MPGSLEPISAAATLEDALRLLRRPPAPAAVRFKPLADAGGRCQLAAYTDVRFVIELLNAVCGARWHAAYTELPQALRASPRKPDDPPMLFVACALTVLGVTRSDVGEGRDGTAHGAGPKAAYSDALKRAAVHFGVNQALYAMRTPWLPVFDGRPAECPPTHVLRTAAGRVRVPDATLERLRALYARWLAGPGRAFGSPIDLGDQAHAAGLEPEPADTPAEQERAAAPPPERPAARAAPAGPAPAAVQRGQAAAQPDPGEAGAEEAQDEAAAPARAGSESAQRESGRVVAIGAARAETQAPRPIAAPPGTPAERAALRRVAGQAGIDDDTLSRLAGVLCGERTLDRLPGDQLAELASALNDAIAAGLAPTTLTRAAAKAAAADGPRDAVARALRDWLAERAQQARQADAA